MRANKCALLIVMARDDTRWHANVTRFYSDGTLARMARDLANSYIPDGSSVAPSDEESESTANLSLFEVFTKKRATDIFTIQNKGVSFSRMLTQVVLDILA